MKRNLKISILAIITIFALIVPVVPVMATTPVNPETTFVAKIGDKSYATLAEAVSAVPTDGTQTEITLLSDIKDGAGFKVQAGQNVVIDFNTFTFDASKTVGSTGTETNGCQLLKGSNVVFKNGKLVSSAAKLLIQNYSNLTLDNMTVDTTMGDALYALSANCGKVQMIGNTTIKSKTNAFDMCWAPNPGYPEGTQIIVDTTSTIQGDIELDVWGKWADDVKSTLTIKNVNHVGKIVATEPRLKGQVTITGGTFSSDVSEYVAEGYVCKKVGDIYVVGKEKEVKLVVEPVEAGKLTADLSKALKGEVVSIVTTVKEGYELKEVTVKDASNNVVEVKDGKFVMPDSEVTVTATFAKLTQVVEVPTIDPTEEVKAPTVGVTDKEKVNDVLLGALNDVAKEDKELKEILETKNVEVVVDLKDVEIDEELQKEIDTILKESEENVSIAKFFDISLVIKADGDNVGSLTELEKPVEFTIALPTDLQNVASGVKRVFYIVREHEGKYDLLETTMSEDGKFLTFESDKFSLYTLAYVDVKEGNGNGNNGDNGNTGSEDNKENEENKDNSGNTQNQEKTDTPKTGDIVLPIFTGIAVISVAGIVFFAVKNKKNRK